MVNYREILRLHSLGQSQRTIRSSAHCSDNTVRTVLKVASQKGICIISFTIRSQPLIAPISTSRLNASCSACFSECC